MSLALTSACVQADTPKRPPAALRLLAELCRRMNDGAVSVSRAELAESLEVSERTIMRARGALTVAGLIEVLGSDERHTPNTYRVRL